LYHSDATTANLAFLTNHESGRDNIDRTRFELLLGDSRAQTGDNGWQLIFTYNGKMFVFGDGVASMASVLDGVLWASASAVISALSE
jgi:hypothetical protein